MNSYKTVKGVFEHSVTIERSKFICYVKNVEDSDEAKEFIDAIRKKNSLATHNCYAFIADENGLTEKFSDDGEPQGTAGKPILDALKYGGFKKIVAVVTRYFGGIKLGVGGLSRAYGKVTAECLKNADVSEMVFAVLYRIKTDYEGYGAVLSVARNFGFSIYNTEFDREITVFVAVKKENENVFNEKITDATNGKAELFKVSEEYFDFGGLCR